MRCACRRGKRACSRCRAASAAASRCAACCSRTPTCCCSTSRRTIWTPSRSHGSSASSRSIPGTVIAVTHDRYFLDNVAGWILELDRGHGIPWQGNYSSWLEQKEQRLKLEEKQEAARQRTIKTELEWVRTNPGARRAKAKARLARFEELTSKEFQTRNETNEIYIPPGPRLGDLVIEADKIGKAFGDRVLFENLSFSLPAGGIVGVIGPNGAGKTTLFRMLAGQDNAGRRRDPRRRHRADSRTSIRAATS